MILPPQIEAYWRAYCAALGDHPQPPLDIDPIWHFGDLEAAGRVGQLTKDGIKTASSSLLWHLEAIGEPVPTVGACGIVADGANNPICILQLTEVEIRPFNQVDAQFASDYGEYGRILEQWRVASWAYFSEVCARIGRESSETMPMVCQRFGRVYP